MIRHIARKELTEVTRDGRFLWTSLIVALLLLVSLGVGAQRYKDDRNLRAAATAETRQQWLNQGDKGPHTAGHYGVYAFKPATPLALFDPGYNDYTGSIQYLEAHKENQASFKPAADATAMQRFGDLSGAMVLQMLVPMLIILLCFGMISGEREDGTFRQLLSMGVARGALIRGKAMGVTLALGLVLVPAIVIGLLLAGFMTGANEPHEMIDFPAKLMVLFVCYAIFFAIFISLSLSASIVAKSSAAALSILIGFWIIAGLLIPRVAMDISKRVYPTPSSFEVASAIERGRDKGPHAHEPNHPNHIAFRNEMLAKYNVSKVEELPRNFVGLALQRDEEVGFKVFDEVFGGVRRAYENQDAVQHAFAVLSPFVAMKAVSSALSGTDVDSSNEFSQAAESYRRQMIGILNEDLMTSAVGVSNYQAEWGYKASNDLWKKVPAFDFDPPSLATILSRNVMPITILLIWLAGSIALLIFSAKRARMDV